MASSSSSSALRGAHLADAAKHAAEQPSIFDIISQESLMKSLKPAGRHLFRYLALVHPERFSKAHRNYDELYALFDLLLQNHFLSRYGASFSENFYGMKRVGGSSRIRNLLVLVVWPYIRDKLDALHEKLKDNVRPKRPGVQESWKTRIARAFLAVYPYLKAALSAWTFVLHAGYVCSWTSVHSPFLLAAGVRLEKLTPSDIARFEGVPLHLTPGILPRIWRFILSLPGVCSRLFAYGLFFVQFLDFLYNSDAGAKLGLGNNLTPWKPPPAPHRGLREAAVQQLETHKCPICLNTRENDTVLAVSGYVFCYQCIHDHLIVDPKCPVTGLPATTTQLIRLYLNRDHA